MSGERVELRLMVPGDPSPDSEATYAKNLTDEQWLALMSIVTGQDGAVYRMPRRPGDDCLVMYGRNDRVWVVPADGRAVEHEWRPA